MTPGLRNPVNHPSFSTLFQVWLIATNSHFLLQKLPNTHKSWSKYKKILEYPQPTYNDCQDLLYLFQLCVCILKPYGNKLQIRLYLITKHFSIKIFSYITTVSSSSSSSLNRTKKNCTLSIRQLKFPCFMPALVMHACNLSTQSADFLKEGSGEFLYLHCSARKLCQ